jgi:hypothetical protein
VGGRAAGAGSRDGGGQLPGDVRGDRPGLIVSSLPSCALSESNALDSTSASWVLHFLSPESDDRPPDRGDFRHRSISDDRERARAAKTAVLTPRACRATLSAGRTSGVRNPARSLEFFPLSEAPTTPPRLVTRLMEAPETDEQQADLPVP